MPSTTSENTKEFEQVISAEKAAAEALSHTIEQQNAVFMSFCSALVNETLNAMGKLSAMDISIADSSKKDVEAAKKKASDAIEQKAKTQTSAKNEALPTPVSSPDGGAAPKNIDDAFVSAIGNTMHNAVTAQNNMYIIAQATTTQLVNTIISITTATLATTVAKKEK